MEAAQPKFVVTPNGPYEVSGDLPITPKRAVVSERGEPLAWATADGLPHDSFFRLCRCGQSQDKPFCDDSHLTAAFDGTEVASTEPFLESCKTYAGAGLKVYRVGRLCEHASFCANQDIDWYQMLPDTGDTNVRCQMIGMIEHCPSGALVYEIDGEINEPDISRAVSPIEDGPLWVTGNVTIVRSDGIALETRNRVTLCRCGHSKNKPMCDGTHTEIGFEAKNPVINHEAEGSSGTEAGESGPRLANRIVVGVSESMTAETYAVAAMIAGAASSEVRVIHAGSESAEPERVLSSAIDLAEEAGVGPDRLTAAWRAGSPWSVLADAAEDSDAGLLIVGRGGDKLAQTPRRISGHAPCDVLFVTAREADYHDPYERVLIATDGSATADRAARRGYDLARALGARVELVFVGHPKTGELIVADTLAVQGHGVVTETRLLEGSPGRRILEAAREIDADLIVVGNKGMTSARMLLGTSVPGEVLKGARCDVLLCRTVRQHESELQPGEGGVIERHGEQIAAFVDESGELYEMSAHCSHLGCVVGWNPTAKTFDCPCHGSRFGPLGEVVEGPATKPLGHLRDS